MLPSISKRSNQARIRLSDPSGFMVKRTASRPHATSDLWIGASTAILNPSLDHEACNPPAPSGRYASCRSPVPSELTIFKRGLPERRSWDSSGDHSTFQMLGRPTGSSSSNLEVSGRSEGVTYKFAIGPSHLTKASRLLSGDQAGWPTASPNSARPRPSSCIEYKRPTTGSGFGPDTKAMR